MIDHKYHDGPTLMFTQEHAIGTCFSLSGEEESARPLLNSVGDSDSGGLSKIGGRPVRKQGREARPKAADVRREKATAAAGAASELGNRDTDVDVVKRCGNWQGRAGTDAGHELSLQSDSSLPQVRYTPRSCARAA